MALLGIAMFFELLGAQAAEHMIMRRCVPVAALWFAGDRAASGRLAAMIKYGVKRLSYEDGRRAPYYDFLLSHNDNYVNFCALIS